MGFQNPSAYKTVLKFDIENGDIVNMEDRSKQAEDVRVQDSSKGAHPKSNSPNDIEDWIKKRFSLSLDPKDRLE